MSRISDAGSTAGHRRRLLPLLLGTVLAVGSVVLTVQRLEFKTSRQELLNPQSEFHHRWLKFVKEFGALSDALVVVEGAAPAQVTAVIDAIGEALRAQPEQFCDVLDRFDANRLERKGLYYLPEEQLRSVERYVLQAARLIRDPHVTLANLAALPDLRTERKPAPAVATAPLHWGDSRIGTGAWTTQLQKHFPNYLLAQDGQLGLVLTRLIQTNSGFVPDQGPFRAIETICARIQDAHPEVRIGLTGLPILEHDEMHTSEMDMTWASVLSVLAVTALMWAGFGGLKYPLLGMGALLFGIAWTWGYATLAVGHLNILSMSFGVILIGLGIDFSVHFLARYLEIRGRGLPADAALSEATRQAGPPIIAGGVTTAVAFFATSLAEFQGVAELGLIAGGGVLLCVASTLWILPCGIQWTDGPSGNANWSGLLALEATVKPFWLRPWRTSITCAGCTLFLLFGLRNLSYDHNLLNLQAEGLPSVAWETKLLEHSDRNTWFAVSVADSLEDARKRMEIFSQLESVQQVEELASLLPTASTAQKESIDRIHRALHELSTNPPVLQPIAISTEGDDLDAFASTNQPASTSFAAVSSESQLIQLNAQRIVAAERVWRSLNDLQAISDPRPPKLEDVPLEIRNRFVGRTGKQLVRIYPRENVWQMEALGRFVQQLEQVDPQITGDPVQTYYASRQMKASYIRAGWLAAAAVAVILLIDLRRIGDALLAALPTGLGLLQLFGLMGLLRLPLNPANIIVLPLIIGIGIDDGIHVLHDYRRHGPGAGLTRATVVGIVLTSLTSMIGFGSLMIARHEGLRSLGRVVTLGIACCLFTSIVLLPCVLELIARRNRGQEAGLPRGKK